MIPFQFVLSLTFLMATTASFAAVKIKCAPASDQVSEETTIEAYTDFFYQNNIVPKTELSLNYIEQFKNEFLKFPSSLRRELISAGNKIHIMEGSGVTVDPTWNNTQVQTFDGRPWSEVPGSGGSTAAEYSKDPTRIVINHLYDHHGSVNLFLHEHGHSLDSISSYHGISNSDVWKDLKTSEPNFDNFMNSTCGKYCTNNIEESFAEFFAQYYGCAESRQQMEREVPRVAEFFRRFKTTYNLEDIWDDTPASSVSPTVSSVPQPTPQPTPTPSESRLERLRRRAERLLGRLIPRPNDE